MASTSAPAQEFVGVMMTTRELALRWGVSAGALANDRAQGRSALAYVKIGDRVRYRLVDIVAYEARCLHAAGA